MKLIPLVTVTFVAASSANAQGGPPGGNGGGPPGADFYFGPHQGPNGWMGPPGDPHNLQPPSQETQCWYLHNPTGTWVNKCPDTITKTGEKPPTEPTPEKPPHQPGHEKPPQTVVPPTYATPTPTTYAKTHPHVWHQRPRKLRARTVQDVEPWW